MEHFTNYQQMIAPAMVWESIERNDAVKMAVSFSWKNEEWRFRQFIRFRADW